ncbi:unnamed protein product [Pneumocystis jirovecii]|uniref:Uncharacterized protein n=2 Tax=Pneumocystis jirovecii TaxID=42068 RepID=L0PFC1_PNEJI|nr:uncharacterized protein T551_02684 [Pneumocystis jirovecii RU7]KTW28265.1 hypothetical protein T551_02684 [Pneumocystis jirovecii RU7]CCJ30902.1 unnamed protein product [Pneumocystis jirovecii]
MTQGFGKISKKLSKTHNKQIKLKRGARVIQSKKASIKKAQNLQRALTKSINEKNEAILAQRASYSGSFSLIKPKKLLSNSSKKNAK